MKIKELLENDIDKNINRLIISDVFNIKLSELMINYDKDINFLTYLKYKRYVKKYKKGKPIQYILKKANFYGNDFRVNKNVLIPRPETELLIESTIKEFKEEFNNIKIIDVGTGSGIIAITLKKLFNKSDVTATDISSKALKIAKINAKNNGVNINFIKTNITDKINDRYDLIISNPPYLKKERVIEDLVYNNEPHLALFAKERGLYFYREILERSKNITNNKNIISFEIGYDQKDEILSLVKEIYPKAETKCIKDYNDFDRILIIKNNIE